MKKIYLNEEEKLAVLKVMVNISSHYKSRLPNADKILHQIEIYLKIPNVLSTSYSLPPMYEALNLLKISYSEYKANEDFVRDLLQYLISTSDFGVVKKQKNRLMN